MQFRLCMSMVHRVSVFVAEYLTSGLRKYSTSPLLDIRSLCTLELCALVKLCLRVSCPLSWLGVRPTAQQPPALRPRA